MKHQIEMYVHWVQGDRYHLFSFDNTKYDKTCVLVNKQTIEFDVPEDFNPTPSAIANLEEYKAEINRQFAAKIAEVNEQISKLQAICYEVPA